MPLAERGGVGKTSARKITARQREQLAVELRIAGATYSQIAEQLGCSRTGAFYAVKRALDRLAKETSDKTEQMRALFQARIERLIASYWLPAVSGDLRAAQFVLSLIEREARLFGLDAPTQVQVSWREELERRGLSPSQVFEEMVSFFARQFESRDTELAGAVNEDVKSAS